MINTEGRREQRPGCHTIQSGLKVVTIVGVRGADEKDDGRTKLLLIDICEIGIHSSNLKKS